MTAEAAPVTTTPETKMRIVSSQPIAFRWKRGVLQFATRWSDGDRSGLYWQTVPTVHPDAPDEE
jgi:hypothetical protein